LLNAAYGVRGYVRDTVVPDTSGGPPLADL